MGQWVGLGQIVKNLLNLNLIKMSQFCLKIYYLWVTPTHGWYGWLGGSMGGSGQITNNLINFDLIKIIQFCLKIYDL